MCYFLNTVLYTNLNIAAAIFQFNRARIVLYDSRGARVWSFNATLSAIIISNVHNVQDRSKEILDNRQMRDMRRRLPRPFCFASSINRFAQIVLFDVTLLIRKSLESKVRACCRRRIRHGLFRSYVQRQLNWQLNDQLQLIDDSVRSVTASY